MFLTIFISLIIFIHFFFIIALLKKNYAVIDIGWGLGFILIALISYFHYPLSIKNALSLFLVTLWGLRLGVYLFKRNKGLPEDYRYAEYRKQWGASANLHAYMKVYLFQGLLMFIISLPFIFGMRQELNELTLLNRVGALLWVLGLALEIYSDSYLAWFKKQPENKGKICTSGPWKLCRFPNYFGEVLLWYGIYFLNFSLETSWTLIGPLTINFLILKVTGVPFLEKKYSTREEYREYSQRVPRFVPFTKP
jgi:steroid 5-alpha reductase family enzyme